MYLNHLSTDAAKAHSRDLLTEAEQDRRLALAGRPRPLAPALRAAARLMSHLRPAAS